MGSFTEFKDFNEAVVYVRKNFGGFEDGSKEYKSIQALFKRLDLKEFAIGIQKTMCKCGYVGDNSSLSCIKRDCEEFKKWSTTGNVPTMMCQRCFSLSQILFLFDFDVNTANKVLQFVYKLKAEHGELKSNNVETEPGQS